MCLQWWGYRCYLGLAVVFAAALNLTWRAEQLFLIVSELREVTWCRRNICDFVSHKMSRDDIREQSVSTQVTRCWRNCVNLCMICIGRSSVVWSLLSSNLAFDADGMCETGDIGRWKSKDPRVQYYCNRKCQAMDTSMLRQCHWLEGTIGLRGQLAFGLEYRCSFSSASKLGDYCVGIRYFCWIAIDSSRLRRRVIVRAINRVGNWFWVTLCNIKREMSARDDLQPLACIDCSVARA